MSTAQETNNKAAFKRILDAGNAHDEELLSKAIDEIFAPDARMGTPLPIQATGAQAVKEVYRTLHRAFPDLHIEAKDMIAEGDKVVSRNTVTGTHHGDYLGIPPTGKSVTYNEIFIFRFTDGRIVEIWGVVDALAQLKQLGLVQA